MDVVEGEKEPGVGESPRFGDFELLDCIGQGGMATVVRAKAPLGRGLPTIVALKFLKSELLHVEGAVEAFRYEARLGLRCEHPNLCRTYGYETCDGRSAIVLEYIEGTPLVRMHPFARNAEFALENQRIIAAFVAKVCRGLHALHEVRGEDGTSLCAVHRDVTPQNIVVLDSGDPKLIDFGVAYSENRTTPTVQGLLKGKVAYLPPEYLLGLSWDRRLDVWSLGVLAWELLAGRRLFKREDLAQTVRAVVNSEPDTPSSIRPHLAPTLDRIVLTALERSPDRRFRTAAAMAAALEDFVENSPDLAETPSGTDGARSSVHFRRHGLGEFEGVGS